MPNKEQQRQKKLAKKKAKEKKRQQAATAQKQRLASVSGRISAASEMPVLGAWIGRSLFDDTGIGLVVLVRKAPGGQLAIGNFKIDAFCLGVKECHAQFVGGDNLSDFEEQIQQRAGCEKASPGQARWLVEASIDYAAQFDFAPYGEYEKVGLIWGDIDPQPIASFEFGQDGKPHFMSGPFDEPHQIREIMAKLESSVGEGNYNFTIGSPVPGLGGDWEPRGQWLEIEEDESEALIIDGKVNRS